MAKIMKFAAIFTVVVTMLFVALYLYWEIKLLLTLSITFATIAYHLIMRLLVGWGMDLILHNRANYNARWFQVRPLEHRLYRKLPLKKWKRHIPSYDPSCFDPKLHSWDDIAQAMCQAELVHEVIILFSFLPILATILFGAFWAFLTTSLLAASFDTIFVVLQRYNRPRIVKLANKINKIG